MISQRIYRSERESLLKSLEFVQYGLTSDKEAEHERALDDIRKLLAWHGTSGAWVWDPYLSAGNIMETLFHTPYSRVELLALGAFNKKTRSHLCPAKAQYTGKPQSFSTTLSEWKQRMIETFTTPGNNCRDLHFEFRTAHGSGVPAFHDRFLIFPHKVKEPMAWSLGTSINSLGKGHHILQKVSYARLVMDAFSAAWDKLENNK